jgi:hypothetical protein
VREFIRKGRPVHTPDWGFGVVVSEEETLGMWLVSTVGGPLKAYSADVLVPLVTIDQRIELEIEGMEPGSQLADMVKPFGMSSEDLQDFTVQFNEEAQARIKGPGNDEYTMDGHQKFEEMELDELIEYAEEEVLDLANYCAMLFIRLRRIRNALDAADDLGTGTEEEYEGGTVTADDFKEE